MAKPCTFMVHNLQADNLELLFVAAETDERRYFIVDYNSTQSVQSYTGDRWRVRTRHGVLQMEFRTPACREGQVHPVVALAPCATDDVLPPSAPSASPPIRASFTPSLMQRCGADRALSAEHLSPGMHLLCLLPVDAAVAGSTNDVLGVAIFPHGLRGSSPSPSSSFSSSDAAAAPRPSHIFVLLPIPTGNKAAAASSGGRASLSSSMPSPDELISVALSEIERPQRKPSPHQPPALFSLGGVRLASAADLARVVGRGEGVLLFEGGQWLWPAARIGQEHIVRLPAQAAAAGRGAGAGGGGDGGAVRLRVLSVKPRVLEVDEFLTDRECQHIVGLSEGHMFVSGVSMKEEDAKAGKRSDEYRTSTQYTLQPFQTDELLSLSRRVQLLTRLHIEQVEQIQVLRYLPQQHYLAHHDFFDPADYGSSAGSSSKERGLASNRLVTVFFYLNDVPRGGETAFPRAGGLSQPTNFHDCTRGLAVHPKKRRVVLFYSMLPSGEFDHYSLHAGCDVGSNATKWAANYWIWNTPQQSTLLHRSLRTMAKDLEEEQGEATGPLGAQLGEAGAPDSAGAARSAAAAAEADGLDARVIPSRISRFDRF